MNATLGWRQGAIGKLKKMRIATHNKTKENNSNFTNILNEQNKVGCAQIVRRHQATSVQQNRERKKSCNRVTCSGRRKQKNLEMATTTTTTTNNNVPTNNQILCNINICLYLRLFRIKRLYTRSLPPKPSPPPPARSLIVYA